jgi:nucleotide-binding universal stress UspA family protein
MKILVAFDGTLQAKDALTYGIEKARLKGGEVVAIQVFDRELFVDYDASPDAERRAREEAAVHIDEARAIIREKAQGVPVSVYSTDGYPEQEVLAFARAERADVLLCPPRFRRIIRTYRKTKERELDAEAVTIGVTALSVKQ